MGIRMNEQLQLAVAEVVYEKTRKSVVYINNSIPAWSELSQQDQIIFGRSVDIWMAGLGSNEVGKAWYERSGQMPHFFWDQLATVNTSDIFIFACLYVLEELISRAEQTLLGIDAEELGKALRDEWVAIKQEEKAQGRAVPEDHLTIWNVLDERNKEIDRRLAMAVMQRFLKSKED